MLQRALSILGLSFLLVVFSQSVSADQKPRILVMGDSLLATHKLTGRNVGSTLRKYLKEPILDRSLTAARMIYNLPISGTIGLSIPRQYGKGNWDWVVVNGGGNDLWLGCGCSRCDRKLNKLISTDGRRGTIPGLVGKIRKSGAKVIYVGYLRSPGVGSPIESCRNEGDELERRIDILAGLDSGIHFLSLAEMVPHGDRSYHAIDMIHPSMKASKEIAHRVAQIIRSGNK